MRKFEWQYSTVAYLVLAAYTLGQWNVVFSYASSTGDELNPSHRPEIALTLPSPLETQSTAVAPSSNVQSSLGGQVVLPASTGASTRNVSPLMMMSFQATPQSAIQDANEAMKNDITPQQKEDMARVAYLRHLPETLNVMPNVVDSQQLDAPATELRFRTVFNDIKNEAGFYVNDREVFRFRSSLGLLTPYLRSKQVAKRLYESLEQATQAEKLVLKKVSGQQYDLYLGNSIIASVDAATAKASKLPLETLANVWMKELETALGSVVVASKPPEMKDAPARAVTPQADEDQPTGRYLGSGMASWYGPGFHGRTCADGSRYNMHAMTAAHKTLPFGTKVRVTNQANGKSCVVRITDRGPYAHGRVIDLSKAAASSIGAIATGVASVTLEILN